MRDFTVFDLYVRNVRAASAKTAIVAGSQTVTVITSYSIHYTKLYDLSSEGLPGELFSG